MKGTETGMTMWLERLIGRSNQKVVGVRRGKTGEFDAEVEA